MNKWFGKVGYAITKEVEPGLYEPVIIERQYFGDIINTRWQNQNGAEINDDKKLSKVISIVADQYSYQHCSDIVYVECMNTLWKVTDIEPDNPRLKLTIGGVYNGEQARIAD